MRLVREPLVHFLVLGALLLAIERRTVSPPGREIVLDATAREALAADHLRRTGRAPTPDEETHLVARWVEDEALYREALALRLDRGDVIVRRRLLQKMTLLTEDAEPVPAPGDGELRTWLAAHAERYATPERLSLEHVYVTGPAPDAVRRAAALRARLLAGADASRLGDPFLRGRHFEARSEAELAQVFGAGLAAAATRLPSGVWSSPLRSAYGVHLVRVTERTLAAPGTVDAVRAALVRDWTAARRAELDRTARARIVARYRVRLGPGTSPDLLAAVR
jgi:peptidyl-prolyl cis-trans isomerase C